MPVPNTFANATATIPLSQLDANFATTITLGNTAIQLGNTVSTLNNMTLANVTVTSGNVTLTNVTVATANVTTSQTLNYGTANGVVYLNTSKVATSGTGLVFDGTNLGVGGSSSVSGIEVSRATGVSPTPVELRLTTTTNDSGWSTSNPWGRISFYSADASVGGAKVHASIQTTAQSSAGGNSNLDFFVTDTANGNLYRTLSFQGAGTNTTQTVFYSGGGATAMTLDASGNLKIENGNLVIGTSGKGIDFSATPGTGTSELLNDYEEGTWTPTLASVGASFTYPRGQYGSYCKIGSLVYAQFYIGADASGTTSNACIISNLPFASGNINSLAQSSAGAWVSATQALGFTINNNSTDVTLWRQNAGSPSQATAAQTTGGYIVGMFVYRSA
jgi:hypothetical protein